MLSAMEGVGFGRITMVAWLIVAVLELAMVYAPAVWRLRRILTPVIIMALAVLTGTAVNTRWPILSVLFVAASLYRIVNLLRILQSRMHEQYQHNVVRRSSGNLIMLQGLVIIVAALPILPQLDRTLLLAAQAGMAIVICVSVALNIRRSRVPLPETIHTQGDLLTVSVAIPARNETKDLIDCLHSVLASEYPRLEVLVLDDCSQKKTATIIKDFAHKGVRFVSGDPPGDNWLAKNQAYNTLAQQASGDLILFCGVDTRFSPKSISQLVEVFNERKLLMLDVLPGRPSFHWRSLLLQPLRYWWDLALPRFATDQPPSQSSCWLIDRRYVSKLGGFSAVSRSVRPEGYFARQSYRKRAYQFATNATHFGVQNVKQPAEHIGTALRLRYPELRRQPEMVMLATVAEAVFLLLPIAQMALGIITRDLWLLIPSTFVVACLVASHVTILAQVYTRCSAVYLFNLPLAVATEMWLTNLSMWQYEFGAIEWKGRNICLPVMHTVPSLPPLPDKPKH